jgi:hypothetical protein
MMRRAQGGRVPLPTGAEIAEALAEGREIVACSGVRRSPLICMNVAFHTAGISTGILDEMAGRALLAALKALFPNAAEISASRGLETEYEIAVQEGHMSA